MQEGFRSMKNPFSRAEHQLRMSFDPEYEEKHNKLLDDRKLSRKVLLSGIKRPTMLLIFFSGVVSYWYLFGNPVKGIMLTLLIYVTSSLAWYGLEEILTRKRLGLW